MKRSSLQFLGKKPGTALVFLTLFLVPVCGEILLVPDQYGSIQAAIDAAAANDTVFVRPGEYYEHLRIEKALTLEGDPSSPPLIYYQARNDFIIPLALIDSSGTVELKNIVFGGGRKEFPEFGSTPLGILILDSNVYFENIEINRIHHYHVAQIGGTFEADGLTIQNNKDWGGQADIGLSFFNVSEVAINLLTQDQGETDRTIEINTLPTYSKRLRGLWGGFSRSLRYDESGRRLIIADPELKTKSIVNITNSRIRSSKLSWGDCIKLGDGVELSASGNYFYRSDGGRTAGTAPHSGITLNNHNINVTLSSNTFMGLPESIVIYGSGSMTPDSKVFMESNQFIKNETAVRLIGVSDDALDFGGGLLGSRGNNVFNNNVTDFRFENVSALPVDAAGNSFENDIPKTVSIPDNQNLLNLLKLGAVGTGDVETQFSVEKRGNAFVVYSNAEGRRRRIGSHDFGDLTLLTMQVLEVGVLAHYANSRGVEYLGHFSHEGRLIREHQFGTLKIDWYKFGEVIITQYWNNSGETFVGTFSQELDFLGEYSISRSALEVENFELKPDRVVLFYTKSNGSRYAGHFTFDMNFLYERQQ